MKKYKPRPVVVIALGGITGALAAAIPLVDNGLRASEILSIALAGLVGTGLTAVNPTSTPESEDETL